MLEAFVTNEARAPTFQASHLLPHVRHSIVEYHRLLHSFVHQSSRFLILQHRFRVVISSTSILSSPLNVTPNVTPLIFD